MLSPFTISYNSSLNRQNPNGRIISLTQDKLTSFFGMFTGGSATIDILLNPNDRNKFLKVKLDGKKHKLPVYSAADDISGVVVVEISGTKKYEHMGVRI